MASETSSTPLDGRCWIPLPGLMQSTANLDAPQTSRQSSSPSAGMGPVVIGCPSIGWSRSPPLPVACLSARARVSSRAAVESTVIALSSALLVPCFPFLFRPTVTHRGATLNKRAPAWLSALSHNVGLEQPCHLAAWLPGSVQSTASIIDTCWGTCVVLALYMQLCNPSMNR